LTPPSLAPSAYGDVDVRLARIEQQLETVISRMDERRGQYLEKIEDTKLACMKQDARVTELEKGLARTDEAAYRIGGHVESVEARIKELERKMDSMRETLIRTSVISSLCTGALTAGITAVVMKLVGG
jgi:predicted nuclease with TOPRIM domain